MKQIKLLVKPTHQCNLNCRYCYDKDFNNEMGNMKLNTVEHIAKLASKYADDILWIWHGGEPLKMPLEFYKQSQKILSKYNINRISLQTNGTLLDEKMIKFFDKHDWLIAFSFDYYSHDKSRGLKDKVEENIKKYIKITNRQPGTIKVVDPLNVNNLYKDYQYAKDLDTNMVFNKVFHSSQSTTFSKDNIDKYLEQFGKMFDLWLNDPNPIGIKIFEDFIRYFLGLSQDHICTYTGKCLHRWLGINPKGIIYPCDRWYPKEYQLGNIHDFNSIEEIWNNSSVYKELLSTMKERKKYCKEEEECEIYDFCNGGCNANAILDNGGQKPVKLDCEIRKKEIYYIFNKIKNIDMNNIKNPILQDILLKSGYRSLNFIKQNIIDKNY
jgi:uncharacterized protein